MSAFGQAVMGAEDARMQGTARGAIGAKNLNLRRRMPLSPLKKNTPELLRGDSKEQALQRHQNIALGGKAGVLTKFCGGGWSKSLSIVSGDLDSEPTQSTGAQELEVRSERTAANRTRVKSEVDEALSEIHESIAELAILLQKDEIASEVVETIPQRREQSPLSSAASEGVASEPKIINCVGWQVADRSPESRREGSGPNFLHASCRHGESDTVKLPDPSILSSNDASGQQLIDACAADKVFGDLSYDLSMSFSVLGKSRVAERDSGMCTDNIDVTNLSMNLSRDDDEEPANKRIPGCMAGATGSGKAARRQSSFFQVYQDDADADSGAHQTEEDVCTVRRKHVMGDNFHTQTSSCENISVTVSDVSGSMHDTCELSKCEVADASKCSPSPRKRDHQILPKGLDRPGRDLLLSPSAPARVGLGIKFKHSQPGAGFPVAAVVPGGPADCAGIEPGDVLMFVACNTMTTVSSSKQVAMSIAHGGSALHIILRRGSRIISTLVRRPRGGVSAIGTAIAKDPSRNPHVCSVAAGSPAEEAGILAGDEVVAVGAQCVARLQRDDLLDLLSGQHGSLVVLGIARAGSSGVLEWMAVRRSEAAMNLPASPPLRTNAIVPKSGNPPAYAAQANQYAQDAKKPGESAGQIEACHGLGFGHVALQPRQEDASEFQTRLPATGVETSVHYAGALHRSRGPSPDRDLHSAALDPQLADRAGVCDRPGSSLRTSREPSASLPQTRQPSVLRCAPIAQPSLPQAVVAVGGATVSMCPDLYKSSASSADAPGALTRLPSSQHYGKARAGSPQGAGARDPGLGRCGSCPPAANQGPDVGRGRTGGAGHIQLGMVQLGKPVETLLSVRSAAPGAEQSRAAGHEGAVRRSGADWAGVGRAGDARASYHADPRAGEARSAASARALSSDASAGAHQVLATKPSVAQQERRLTRQPCELDGDALVAAAIAHIHKYESQRVIKTEHARRVDADVTCIVRATGVSEMHARKALEEAYLDPVEAILKLKFA